MAAMEKNNKTLNVPHLRFPEFSGEWDYICLSDIADIVGGGTPDTSVVEYWGGNILWFTPSEIGKEKYARLSERTITEAGIKNSSAKLLPQGTVLLSSRATIGECSIARQECTTNQGFQSLIAETDKVTSEFLYYLVPTIKKEMLRRSCGSTFLEISANELRKIYVYRPSLIEQNKLAEFMSLLDLRIETQKKIIEDLKKLKDAITHSHYRNELSHSPMVYIGKYITQVSKRNKDAKIDRVLSVSNKYGFIDQDEQFEDREVASADTSNYKVVHKGDFAYNPARINVGSVARLQEFENGIVSPMYVCFTVKKGLLPEYFDLYLSTNIFKHEMNKRLEGSVRLCLTYESLCNIRIALPEYNVQADFVAKVSAIFRKIKSEEKLLVLYHNYKQYLLSHMFI